jgi:2,4-dienoyl-CoA reductase-like NADH-dependent reductase (Old Yellow Enzyme family)
MMKSTLTSGHDDDAGIPEYLRPGKIGSLVTSNRLIRAATSETMASQRGEVTDELINLYSDLARGGAGVLITGHAYGEEGGQCSARQIGIYSDKLTSGLARLPAAVHEHGGRIFCELSHAGSQSVMPNVNPMAPSIIENAIFARQPREMSEDDIERVVEAFAQAARRAAAAGFDGIHIHGGNGYLISQFSSPFSNRRSDKWGGDADRRSRFFWRSTTQFARLWARKCQSQRDLASSTRGQTGCSSTRALLALRRWQHAASTLSSRHMAS